MPNDSLATQTQLSCIRTGNEFFSYRFYQKSSTWNGCIVYIGARDRHDVSGRFEHKMAPVSSLSAPVTRTQGGFWAILRLTESGFGDQSLGVFRRREAQKRTRGSGGAVGGASEIQRKIGCPHCNLAPGFIAYAYRGLWLYGYMVIWLYVYGYIGYRYR